MIDGDQGNEFEEKELFIERDTLIQLHCKRGETVTVENYRVLCPFAKNITINGTSVWIQKGLLGIRS